MLQPHKSKMYEAFDSSEYSKCIHNTYDKFQFLPFTAPFLNLSSILPDSRDKGLLMKMINEEL